MLNKLWTNKKRKFLIQRSKKHTRTSPEIQLKEKNEILGSALPKQVVLLSMPAKTRTKSSQKVEKIEQSNKQNKNILIAKIFEAFSPKAKSDTFGYNYFKKSGQIWN